MKSFEPLINPAIISEWLPDTYRNRVAGLG